MDVPIYDFREYARTPEPEPEITVGMPVYGVTAEGEVLTFRVGEVIRRGAGPEFAVSFRVGEDKPVD